MAVWGIGVAVYFVAITYRTSLGVAGLDAAERFHINASALSTFSILQLLVYAGMQIPVGLMVDRLGPKKVLTLGVVLYTARPVRLRALRVVRHGARLARAARLRGRDDVHQRAAAGLPVVPGPARADDRADRRAGRHGGQPDLHARARPVPAQLRLDPDLRRQRGGRSSSCWRCCCSSSRTTPRASSRRPAPAEHTGPAFVRRQITEAWREPGTRLGMWVHFTTQFPAMVFLLLWGLPFLVEAQGLSRGTAGELLTLVVLSNMAVGPGLRPGHRPPSRGPYAAGPRHRRRHRADVGDHAGLAGRACADGAAGRAVRRCWAPAAPPR